MNSDKSKDLTFLDTKLNREIAVNDICVELLKAIAKSVSILLSNEDLGSGVNEAQGNRSPLDEL